MTERYKNGKIYRIVCNQTEKQYIGSTCLSLRKRLHSHKKDHKKWVNGKRSYTTSFEIIENDNYDIILIEDYPCNTKEQAHSRERYWIENSVCVNKFIPTRTHEEYSEENHNCICGSTIRKNHKARHERSKKHQEYLQSIIKN